MRRRFRATHMAALYRVTMVFLASIFVSTALVAQSVSLATLDAEGVTLQFPARAAGAVVEVFAINLGPVALIQVGRDGVGRLDLRQVPVPDQGRACFFLRRQGSDELYSVSRQTGFYNPFWERRATAAATQGPRSTVAVRQEMAEFDRELAAARAYTAAEEGRRIRNGQCTNVAMAELERPAFGNSGAGAQRYAAQRCGVVISDRPLTCRDVRQLPGMANDPTFTAANCDGLVSGLRLTLNGGARGRQTAERHAAIVRGYADQVAADPSNRPAIARQCMAEIEGDSERLLADWRQQRDETNRQETAAGARCESALQTMTDADERQAALTSELAAARAAESAPRSRQAVVSMQARDYPCALR